MKSLSRRFSFFGCGMDTKIAKGRCEQMIDVSEPKSRDEGIEFFDLI